MMTRTLAILCLLLALVGGESAARAHGAGDRDGARDSEGATSVELRRFVRLAKDEPVTIASIAEIVGPAREAIGAIELHASASEAVGPEGRTASIGGESVRGAIQRAGERGELASVDVARVTVRGVRCQVMAVDPDSRPAARIGDAPSAPTRETGAPTLRTAAALRIAEILDVPEQDLRLRFEDRDAEVLSTPIAGRAVEIVATGASDRLPLSITVFDGARTALEATIRVGVEIRREVLVASVPMRRGQRVESAGVVRESRWVAPGAAPADPREAIGHELRRNVEPGDMLDARDLEPPIVVRRGDRVLVRTISGSVVVRAQARALGAGRPGETIELESLSGDRRRFRGQIDGPGRVIVLTPNAGAGETITLGGGRR
ncbi:MAG: flagella basal body P-ring formation protein FlgA [Phycisphaerales bacterium]|nr:MAG: flagella basal body P-ring formation protein FlgA [Phycisphaerales bacterium]